MLRLLEAIYDTYLSISPYLFLGLIFAGLLHIIFKKDFVAKHLGKNNFFSVIKAAILGVPLPLCSCGVIPTAMFLRREKASKGATMSFLISTPQTGVDSILATYGMMGPIFAIFRPIAAFITGILGGAITNIFDKDNTDFKLMQVEADASSCCSSGSCHSHENSSDKHDTKISKIWSGMNYAFVEFLDDISGHLIVGVILAGLISFLIPDNFFTNYGGDGLVGMLIMIAVGIPLYVCATSSIPIAVSLMLKGISPGAAFVFLVVGPATNAATITLIANTLGKKLMVIYLSVISIFAIISGLVLNMIFNIFGQPKLMLMQHEMTNNWFVYLTTAIFSILLIASLYRKFRNKFIKTPKLENLDVSKKNNIFKIEGMTCNHCVANVKNALESVQGVTDVKINLALKTAVIEGNFDDSEIADSIEKAGYKLV